MRLRAGARIGRHLELRRKLGRGAMGVVWRAAHRGLDTVVAVKLLSDEHLHVPGVKKRFLREARSAAAVKSPHVVEIYDCAELDDGTPYIVMEHLEGRPLGAWLDDAGPLPPAQAVDFVSQIAEALHAAHGVGVVHRDVKPSNVLVVEEAAGLRLKLTDFGVAKALESGGDVSVLTKTGVMVGSVPYMSPEQIRDASRVDYTADLWALTVVAYELTTGVPPFDVRHDWSQIVSTILSGGLPPPTPPLPGALGPWFRRAFHRDRDQRFGSARALSHTFAEATRRVAALRPDAPLPTVTALTPPLDLDGPDASDTEPVDTEPTLEQTEPGAPALAALPSPLSPAAIEALHAELTQRPRDAELLRRLFSALPPASRRRRRVARALLHVGGASREHAVAAPDPSPDEMIQPRRPLDAAWRRSHLRHADEDVGVGDILGLVAPALVAAQASRQSGAGQLVPAEHRRLGAEGHGRRWVTCVGWAAQILAVTPVALYLYPEQREPFRAVPSDPWHLRVGEPAVDVGHPRAQAFVVGYWLTAFMPERMLAWALPSVEDLQQVFLAALAVGHPPLGPTLAPRVQRLSAALGGQLDDGRLSRLRLRVAEISGRARAELGRWRRGAVLSAARAGLLLCDDLGAAAYAPRVRSPGITREAILDDLIVYSTSRAYDELQNELGIA